MRNPIDQNNNSGENEHPGLPVVELEEARYEVFGEWLDVELEKLVARWIHLAAPNASRPSRKIKPR
jgi:hypothetical protein